MGRDVRDLQHETRVFLSRSFFCVCVCVIVCVFFSFTVIIRLRRCIMQPLWRGGLRVYGKERNLEKKYILPTPIQITSFGNPVNASV